LQILGRSLKLSPQAALSPIPNVPRDASWLSKRELLPAMRLEKHCAMAMRYSLRIFGEVLPDEI